MEQKDNYNGLNETNEPKDCFKLQINLEDEKYFLKIFISKDKLSIIFLLELEKIKTYYYYGKFYLNEIIKINKKFNSDRNIIASFIRLKDLAQNSKFKLEKKPLKINIYIIKNNSEFIAIFILRKKGVEQKRLNFLLDKEIQENKVKINLLKKQIIKLDKIIQGKNDLLEEINNNIIKLKNEIYNINNNLINYNNNNFENGKNNNDQDLFKNKIANEDKQKILKEDLMKKKIQKNEVEKIKKEYKINLQKNNSNNDSNLKDTLYSFGDTEVIKNKKIYEALIAFNIISVIIIIYLLSTISDLNSFLIYRMKDQGLLKKITILNIFDNYPEDELGGIRDNIIDFHLKNNNNKISKDEEELNNPRKKLTYIIRRKSKKKSLLYSEREKRFFRKHIKRKIHYRAREIDLNLIYNSFEFVKYNYFYFNISWEKNFDILIIMKNKLGNRFALFTNNNIFQGANTIVKGSDYAGYEFNEGKIIENNLKEFNDKYFNYLQNIFYFLQNEKINLKTKLTNTSTQLLGDIDFFEIYSVNYVK